MLQSFWLSHISYSRSSFQASDLLNRTDASSLNTLGGSNSGSHRWPVSSKAAPPGFLQALASWPGGLTRQAYSITETAPLFCRHRKNKRRALMRVQEAHLPDSLGPDPPWAHAASGSTAALSLRLQPSISLCLITFVLASVGALQQTGDSFS